MQVAKFPAGPQVRAWARKHGFSEWMVARYAHMGDEPGRLLEGLLSPPPRYLRVNPLRATVEGVRKSMEARDFRFASTGLDPQVLRVRDAPHSIGATVEHLGGETTPQDLASASAPLALGAKPGDLVADLAAAPGVKTLHVAGDLAGKGAIVAVEPDRSRRRALQFNLERGGATTPVILPHAAQETPGSAWADHVLLDAPCTGEGTLPRDRKRRRGQPEEIARLAVLQEELLDVADRILRPGGRLVYATCALAPEENEMQMDRMVQRGYHVLPLPFETCGSNALHPGLTQWGGKRLDDSIAMSRRFLPGIHPTLGFYVALLRKEGP